MHGLLGPSCMVLSIHTFWFHHSLAVSSGSMTINPDSSVQILVEEGFPLDQLDLQVGVVWCGHNTMLGVTNSHLLVIVVELDALIVSLPRHAHFS